MPDSGQRVLRTRRSSWRMDGEHTQSSMTRKYGARYTAGSQNRRTKLSTRETQKMAR